MEQDKNASLLGQKKTKLHFLTKLPVGKAEWYVPALNLRPGSFGGRRVDVWSAVVMSEGLLSGGGRMGE